MSTIDLSGRYLALSAEQVETIIGPDAMNKIKAAVIEFMKRQQQQQITVPEEGLFKVVKIERVEVPGNDGITVLRQTYWTESAHWEKNRGLHGLWASVASHMQMTSLKDASGLTGFPDKYYISLMWASKILHEEIHGVHTKKFRDAAYTAEFQRQIAAAITSHAVKSSVVEWVIEALKSTEGKAAIASAISETMDADKGSS